MNINRTKRTLVVDDLRLTRRILVAALAGLGLVDITEASDGQQAWAELDQSTRPFDLIIADWHMPNLTGLELLARVRADHRYVATPFLMFTSENEPDQIANAVEIGVTGYLNKPLNVDQLNEQIARIPNLLTKSTKAI